MRKAKAIVLVTILVTSLTACAPKSVSNEVGYKDGTYLSKGEKWDFGSEEATVVIKGGKIDEVLLARIDTEGNEVDYDSYQKMGGPDLAEAREKITKAMLEKQTFKVDSISGASISSGNWMVAVERALEKATQ